MPLLLPQLGLPFNLMVPAVWLDINPNCTLTGKLLEESGQRMGDR